MKMVLALIYLSIMSFIYVRYGIELSFFAGFFLLVFSFVHLIRRQNFFPLVLVIVTAVLFGVNTKVSRIKYESQFTQIKDITEVQIINRYSFEHWQGATGNFKYSGTVFLVKTELDIEALRNLFERSINLENLKPEHLCSVIPYSITKSYENFELQIRVLEEVPDYLNEYVTNADLKDCDYVIQLRYFEEVLL